MVCSKNQSYCNRPQQVLSAVAWLLEQHKVEKPFGEERPATPKHSTTTWGSRQALHVPPASTWESAGILLHMSLSHKGPIKFSKLRAQGSQKDL